MLSEHKEKIKEKITTSELDKIKGIGMILKARLIKRFKNIKNIKSASLEDLMTVQGINERIAKEIIQNINVKNS